MTQGEYVARFEHDFAEWLGVRHAVAVSSGTAALHLALVAAGIGKGDRVVVPSSTFVATANAVLYAGATPIFCDIDAAGFTLDTDILAMIFDKYPVKAVIAVHLYGTMANMFDIRSLCFQHDAILIEDTAQALGAEWCLGKKAGTLGLAGCFSFYGNKTLTTGEGGMVVTNDPEIDSQLRHYRGQAQVEGMRYFHDALGFNYRMTDLQAAIGIGQIPELDANIQKRRQLWNAYELIGGAYTDTLDYGSEGGAWAMPMRFDGGYTHAERALEQGLEIRPTFYPLPLLPHLAQYPAPTFKNAHDKYNNTAVLPIYPSLSEADINEIVGIMEKIVYGENKTLAS